MPGPPQGRRSTLLCRDPPDPEVAEQQQPQPPEVWGGWGLRQVVPGHRPRGTLRWDASSSRARQMRGGPRSVTREARCQRGPWGPFPRACPHRGEGDSWGAAPTRPALGALQLAKRGGLWHLPQKPPVVRRSWPSRQPRPREGDQAGGQREVACKGGVCSHFTGEKTEAPGGHRTPMRPHSGGEELSLGPNQATPPPPTTCWAGSHAPGWRRHFRVDGSPLGPAPFSAPAPASPQTFRDPLPCP